jgi:hypothetical protein
MTGALLGVLVAAFGIIKLLTILGDEATIWAWIGVILAILVAVGAYMQVQEAGGIDTLRSDIPSSMSSGSGAATTTAPPPPPPASTQAPPEATPPAEPAPPAEPEAPVDGDERRDV